jgi:hypothetical protein
MNQAQKRFLAVWRWSIVWKVAVLVVVLAVLAWFWGVG